MMLNDHDDAASRINGEIEDVIRRLDSSEPDTYLKLTQAIRELAIASTMLVPPDAQQ